MNLNTRSEVPDIKSITDIPDYQISVHFALRPAIFKIQATLRQACTKGPQNDLEYVTSVPDSQFQPILLYHQLFLSYRPF